MDFLNSKKAFETALIKAMILNKCKSKKKGKK
jgi:hypothetical protein